jgi:hypothetical protein
VETSLEETPTHSWRQALERKMQDAIEDFAEEVTASIQTRIHTELYDEPSTGMTSE